MLLLPCDLLQPRRTDLHFAPEAAAARELGVTVAEIDHDAAWRADPQAAVRRVPRQDGPPVDAVYRGWMLHPDRYAALDAALRDRGVRLRTDAARYARAHQLPGWYAALALHTPESVWTTGTDPADVDRALAVLDHGPAVVKDHVKSLKHAWHEACYIPDVADRAAARAVTDRFVELRGDDLVGGLVLRRFEEFTGAEVRTWWVAGRCVLTGPHPDTPDKAPPADLPDLVPFAEALSWLDLPFVTLDLARRADGVWRVVELGDGQVSDLPAGLDPGPLLAALG